MKLGLKITDKGGETKAPIFLFTVKIRRVMRKSKVIRIEGKFEIIGVFINEVLIQTMRRRIYG